MLKNFLTASQLGIHLYCPFPQDLLVTTWDGAYHWHTDKTISAVDAIKLRENGRKESGDYWCHKSCHSRQPRDGIELYPRNHPITPHFWKGSGNFTKINDCEFYQLQIERKESTRYSQFYHDLRSWLDTDEAKQNLGFSTYSENKARKYSDFILVATASKDVTWTEMEIIVVHKNRKRVPQTNNYIRIDLSQWKIEHILNFEGYGKRMIIEEFNQLITKFSNQLEKHKLKQEIEEMIETLSQKYRHNNILIKEPISKMFNSVEEVEQYFNREEEKEKKRKEEYDQNHAADIAIERQKIAYQKKEDKKTEINLDFKKKELYDLAKNVNEAIIKDQDINLLSLKQYSRGLLKPGDSRSTWDLGLLTQSGLKRTDIDVMFAEMHPIPLWELQAYVVGNHGMAEYHDFEIEWAGLVPHLSMKYRKKPLLEKREIAFQRKDKLIIRCLIRLFEEFEKAVLSDENGNLFSGMFNTSRHKNRQHRSSKTTHVLNNTIKEDISYGMLLKLSSNDGINDLNGVIKSKTFIDLNAKNYLMPIDHLKHLNPDLWTLEQVEAWKAGGEEQRKQQLEAQEQYDRDKLKRQEDEDEAETERRKKVQQVQDQKDTIEKERTQASENERKDKGNYSSPDNKKPNKKKPNKKKIYRAKIEHDPRAELERLKPIRDKIVKQLIRKDIPFSKIKELQRNLAKLDKQITAEKGKIS